MADRVTDDNECRLCNSVKAVVPVDDALRNKIVECCKISIFSNDGLPQKVCLNCKVTVCTFYSTVMDYQKRQIELLKRYSVETQPPRLLPGKIQTKQETYSEDEPPAKKVCKSQDEINIERQREILTSKIYEKQLVKVVMPIEKTIPPETVTNDSNRSLQDDKSNQKIPSYTIRYNCTFCLRTYPNKSSLIKHKDSSHKRMIKYCDSIVKPCSVRMVKLNLPSNSPPSTSSGWVHINNSTVRLLDLSVNYCYLSVTKYVRSYAQEFRTIDCDSNEGNETNITSEDGEVENDSESCISNNELFPLTENQNEDDFDKFLNSKSLKPDEVRIIVKKSYEEFSASNFHAKFVSRLKSGSIKVLWINNDKSVGEPYFLESAALHKHLQKKNGLCSNMIGLQPYKNQNLTTPTKSELKKDDIPPLSAKETEKPKESLASTTIPTLPIIVSTNSEVTNSQTQMVVSDSVYEGMPKIISAFSIPLLNSNVETENNNTTSNNKTIIELPKSNGVHRPMIKCKPASALMAHTVQPSPPTLTLLPSANNNDLNNITNPSNSGRNISYINNSFNSPQIENGKDIDFEKSIPSTGIFNPVPQEYTCNNIIPGLNINVTNNQNITPIVSNYTLASNLIPTQIVPVSTAPSVPFTAGYPYLQPVLAQPSQISVPVPVINYHLREALNGPQVAEVPSTTKRSPASPFFDLQSILQESGVKLWCAFCWKNLTIARILVKFKIVISEMYKNNAISNTFHVKFNLISGEEFSIGVTNSLEKDLNICQWSNKYQSQLIRAFKKNEILKTISETVHNDENVRKKVGIFLNILSKVNVDT